LFQVTGGGQTFDFGNGFRDVLFGIALGGQCAPPVLGMIQQSLPRRRPRSFLKII
jgi:hypothetical protein